jgi:hypothetical protein
MGFQLDCIKYNNFTINVQYPTLSMKYKATALCLILISLDFQSFL